MKSLDAGRQRRERTFVVHHAGTSRSASALLVVLVVMMLLTLSAYTYTQTMQTEYEAAMIHGQELQARQAADSGIEYATVLLARRSASGDDNLRQNPAVFQAIPVVDASQPGLRARFTLIAAVESDPTASRVRYGLTDESGRLNLNLLDELQTNLQLEDEDITNWLLQIPGMTPPLIDAIRDWIDADDDKRQYGAESETYQSLHPPYSAKNGPLESLDELLMVQGVTPQLLYGEDANRNGLLDPNENDGDASPPFDNADGVLDHGWSAFLTVHSRERNVRADGQPKINLNQGLLTDLYDQLEKEFDENTAKFVVAYRLNGPKNKSQPSSSKSSSSGVASKSSNSASSSSSSKSSGSGSASSQASRSSSGSQSSSASGSAASGSSSSSGSRGSSASSQQQQQAMLALTQQVARAVFQKGGQVTRGGMDLSKGGTNRINSIFDLIGSQTQATVNGATTTLTSPWPDEPSQLESLLPKLMDTLTTSDDDFRPGRININEARAEILLGIPNMTQQLVQAISAAQSRNVDGTPSPDMLRKHSTAGWLYLDGLTDLDTMRKLEPFLTARGDVYRAQVLGFFDSGGVVHRQEAIIDGTRIPPRVVWQRDLNELGRGYLRSQLMPQPTR
jgi:uncharacterized membrane protein YgcG